MHNYKHPEFEKEILSYEAVFAKKSGHRDNGNGKSENTGNIFGPNNGNNDKHKFD